MPHANHVLLSSKVMPIGASGQAVNVGEDVLQTISLWVTATALLSAANFKDQGTYFSSMVMRN